MKWMEIANSLYSSYQENHLCWLLYSLIRAHSPTLCVEFGILHGYSALFMGAAVRANQYGSFHAYDLWEQYPHNHGDYNVVEKNIKQAGLEGWITLLRGDAKEVLPSYRPGAIDFCHIDISNDGDTVRWALDECYVRLSDNGILVLEGGSRERDESGWIVKYNKPRIRPVLAEQERWDYMVVKPYPGMIILRKRQDGI